MPIVCHLCTGIPALVVTTFGRPICRPCHEASPDSTVVLMPDGSRQELLRPAWVAAP